MSLAYTSRLLALCLATFFLVHFAAGLFVIAISNAVVRMTERISARAATRWLFALRLLPPISGLFVVAVLCIPSYLWWEPEMDHEDTGILFLVLALLGLAVWSASIYRTSRAAGRSRDYISRCESLGVSAQWEGETAPIWIVEETNSIILAGILHSRLFVSRKAVTALSPEELAAALRHESAHQASRDNLKRLFILLSPGLLPFYHGFHALENHWSRLTEWAADDWAVNGDSSRCLSLASALVQVARLNPSARPSSIVTSFLDDSQGLAARVDRLLQLSPPEPKVRISRLATAGTLAFTVLFLGVMLRPAALQSIHRLLEDLVH